MNEIRVHWNLENCNSAVRLLSLFEDDISVFIVLEFQPKGSLMTVLESGQTSQVTFSEPQVRVIIEQLLLALDYF